jgi:hypothetical protein
MAIKAVGLTLSRLYCGLVLVKVLLSVLVSATSAADVGGRPSW